MGSYAENRRRLSSGFGWIKFVLLGVVISIVLQGTSCEVEPTESQCRPYIEKALKEQHGEVEERYLDVPESEELLKDQEDNPPTDEFTYSTEGATRNGNFTVDDNEDGEVEKEDDEKEQDSEVDENDDEKEGGLGDNNDEKTEEENDNDDDDDDKVEAESKEEKVNLEENTNDQDEENMNNSEEEQDRNDDDHDDQNDHNDDNDNDDDDDDGNGVRSDKDDEKSVDKEAQDDGDDDNDKESILETPIEIEVREIKIDDNDDDDETDKGQDNEVEDEDDLKKDYDQEEQGITKEYEKIKQNDYVEEEKDINLIDYQEPEKNKDEKKPESGDDTNEVEKENKSKADEDKEDIGKTDEGDDERIETNVSRNDEIEKIIEKRTVGKSEVEETAESDEAEGSKDDTDQESTPEEEELTIEVEIPENLRSRDHIDKILKLEDSEMENILEKAIDATLKSLKNLYDNAIKPLEMLYKYRDLSNRHFGDPEIFSKPLILFMGPWSGGKSSTINYLLDNEFSHTSLRTGAEPSPAYFNILMHGEEQEILDGTQLAADWTFSGLQKFGQSLLDRLKGIKLPNKLLEKVNIVEIPGILEIRKQVQRLFPFNDACQWFIDRADIIFLVYDPSKLDVGPETEAILDQLKGREYQTRIILNKADQVKPEELMRVQGTLIWNISPLMSSSEPPIMYSTSLWSLPYEAGAPTRLLMAQERAFLRDLREAIDKRVENKIASARRFAVRVRNHAKMVDCYLTTYYNHKSFFGNRKKISDDIIEYPQKYHIYEGLSTLTNISRYDLPDPDVYRDFFKINPLYDFKKLSETCTYFRGCPINKLDVAIAYDLPELVGKYRKAVEAAKEQLQKEKS